jgi:hypothetical protein
MDAANQHEASSATTSTERPLTRGKWTYYGDGLTEYEYTPPSGRVQRVCGVLGKNKQAGPSASPPYTY